MSTWYGKEVLEHCCEKPDVEVVLDEYNMWYHGCWVKCYNCDASTEYFDHNGDQESGIPLSIDAWNNKEFRTKESKVDAIIKYFKELTASEQKEALELINK